MIGPHEGNELELMLQGKKSLAVFYDVYDGVTPIPEQIIPETKFLPYVKDGTIVRISEDIKSDKTGDIIRFVCFVLKGEEWRARFFLWYKANHFSGAVPYDVSHEYIIGSLLDYDQRDIKDYIRNLVYYD